METLRKFLYISIIVGTFTLSGCSNEEAANEEEKADLLLIEQTTPVNNTVTNAKEVAAPVPLNLTSEQKQEYYEKYIVTVEKVNDKYSKNFELEPITKFEDDFWYEVDDFEKLLVERTTMSVIVSENNERFNPALVPKLVTFQFGANEETFKFYGSFDTQLNSNTTEGRQLFSEFHSISLQPEDQTRNFVQTGFQEYLVDGGTTYLIDVGGKYSQNGIISSHIFQLQFDCDKNGGIS